MSKLPQSVLLTRAFHYSVPVLLGYTAIGTAFGLFAVERGYPWYAALVSGVVMYAGAGQFIALGLFAAGASLAEAVLVEFVVNARHMAYGLSMLRRYRSAGPFRFYLIFGLTDETFALLSSLPGTAQETASKLEAQETAAAPKSAIEAAGHTECSVSSYAFFGSLNEGEKIRFMFFVTLLDQVYWNLGILAGSLAGSLIPWNFEGVGFSLTALFIVLMIEQILRLKRAAPFVISALSAAAAVFLLPGGFSARFSLLAAMIAGLVLVQLFESRRAKPAGGNSC